MEGQDLGDDDSSFHAEGPPLGILWISIGLVVLAGLLHLLQSTVGHIAGYGVGAVGVTATIAVYRAINRKRSLSGRYSFPQWAVHVPQIILFAGVTVAMSHAWYLAMVRRLA